MPASTSTTTAPTPADAPDPMVRLADWATAEQVPAGQLAAMRSRHALALDAEGTAADFAKLLHRTLTERT